MFLHLLNGPKDRGFTKKNSSSACTRRIYFLLILQVSDRLDHLISGEYNFFASKKAMRAEKNNYL